METIDIICEHNSEDKIYTYRHYNLPVYYKQIVSYSDEYDKVRYLHKYLNSEYVDNTAPYETIQFREITLSCGHKLKNYIPRLGVEMVECPECRKQWEIDRWFYEI